MKNRKRSSKAKMEIVKMYQTLVNGHHPPIELVTVSESVMENTHIDWLFVFDGTVGATTPGSWKVAGMHSCYSKSGHLSALAICVGQKALLIDGIIKPSSPPRPTSATRLHLQSKLLSRSSGFTIVAFNAHELVLALHRDMGLVSARVLDLLSLPPGKRDIVETIQHVTRARVEPFELFVELVREAFQSAVYERDNCWTPVQVAWFASFLANEPDVRKELAGVTAVDSTGFGKHELDFLSDAMIALLVRDLEKPTFETLSVNPGAITYSGSKASYVQTNFGQRLSNSRHQTIKANLEGNISLPGKVTSTKGKQANLHVDMLEGVYGPKIQSMTVNGKARPTQSEMMQSETILFTLQQKLPLFDNYWTNLLFTVDENPTPDDGLVIRPSQSTAHESDVLHHMDSGLNSSQADALEHMLSKAPVSIIKGPPGTGKTTVIAEYLARLVSSGKSAFVTANSNVAVKNIGEKLAKMGLSNWLLVVSDDFLIGWHEHQYKNIPQMNFTSISALRAPPRNKIILCTLSMLSNNKFMSIAKAIQAEYLVVDEASQTPMSSYLPIIAKYGNKLKKFIFIGDDKQLPPYGSEATQALDSIFSKTKLLKSFNLKLLNIQYRMPPAIGNFISSFVYNGELMTWDDHPIKSANSIQFIDTKGSEEPVKKSFKNTLEASTAISVADFINKKQKSYKIITPYDTQRDLLEQKLKNHGLPWENSVFTVDSFQGNESDYIIISLVRTRSIGFLQDQRRSNVMLTRCRRGMFICSNWCFLESQEAKNTLIGKMSKQWAEIEEGWIMDQEELMEKLYIE